MTDPNQTLQAIAEKTKGYKGFNGVSVLTEIICYLMFIGFIALAIYLPYFLKMQLDMAEEEIGFYLLDPEDIKTYNLLLRITLIILSFFPLVTGILLRLMGGMNKKLKEVHDLAIKNDKN